MKKLLAIVSACTLTFLLAACSSGGAQSTSAQSSPSKISDDFPGETITLVCPFSAGGGTDLGARYMATALSDQLGVNVVVENETGSGGWVAWTDLINGDYSDGNTIGLINQNFVMGEIDPENPRDYNLDDVQLLCNQALDYNVLAIRTSDDRFTDIESFLEYAKNNSVLVSAQATGITDGDSTTAEWFNKTFGTQISVIPVDGASDSRGMFLAGDTDVLFASISDVLSSYQSGEMKILCVFADQRSDFMPDIPTIEEASGQKLIAFAARGYFYPKSVDSKIVSYMTDAMMKAMQDKTYIQNMSSLGLQLDNTSGDEYVDLLNSQVTTREAIWG
ncbi:hypothetical protein OBV_44090 [Oscillibacter valericigenes Sjm18-20]|nr:hypothetical protein OBV_44090 [Oscillibacter valericigenes Sjm18-20]